MREYLNYVVTAMGWTLLAIVVLIGVLYIASLAFKAIRWKARWLLAGRDRPWRRITQIQYRHLTRGSTYVRVGEGRAQCATPIKDMDALVAYRDKETGAWWFRPPTEFEDPARFEYEGVIR